LLKGESLRSNGATINDRSLTLLDDELRMQHDGNLVHYRFKSDGSYEVIWSSGTVKDGDARKEPYSLLL